jgi:hypothetical protein
MRPVILILEARPEVAEALSDVVTSASYDAMIRPHLESLADLGVPPAAIIVRIAFEGIGEPAHAAIQRLPANRPPVIAIAWEPNELEEAARLKCDVILRAPDDVGRLCDALINAVNA